MKNNERCLFVINPVSGGLNKEALRSKLEIFCQNNQLSAFFIKTTGQDDVQKIRKKIEECRANKVIACGGDGTVNIVGKAALAQSLPLGIIPVGSANGLATELGLQENVDQSLKLIKDGNIIEMDVLKIDPDHLCFHLADVGLNARLVQAFESSPQRGKLAYLRHFIKSLGQKKATRVHVTSDKKDFKAVVEMVILANATKFGTGAIINPQGKIDDGLFETCLVRPFSRLDLLRLFFLSYTGRLNHSKYVKTISVKKAHLKFSGPLPLQIDGEVIDMVEEVGISLHTRKLKVLAPPSY